MLEGQIARCMRRIADEESLAREAGSADAAMAHLQAAMIFRSELQILRRQAGHGPRADVWQMLAEIG